MPPISAVFVFIFGAIVGSFLNVCIYRIPRDISIIWPPSTCPFCDGKIKFYQNIPLVSYIILHGKCAYCKEKISSRYFFIELLTALLALALVFHFKNYYISSYYFLFTSALTVVFFIDLDHKLIFDEITYAFTFIAILGSLFLPYLLMGNSNFVFIWEIKNLMLCNLFNSLMGAVLGMLFFQGIRFFGTIAFKQEAMGLGDVKLAMMIGAFLGPQKAFLSFFLSFFIGAIAAIYLILLLKKKGKDEIPFGTFMAIGSIFAVFYGDALISFYLSSILCL